MYVISRPRFDLQEFACFLEHNGLSWNRTPGATQAEEVIEVSGRLSRMSYGESQGTGNVEFIDHLISRNHENVLEHIAWTFILTGISRSFTHQLVRHRIGFSYTQLSQEYYDECGAEFVTPELLENLPDVLQEWQDYTEDIRQAYGTLLAALRHRSEMISQMVGETEVERTIRSMARSILPNATETMVVVTANARAIRHFLTVRGGEENSREMRVVCTALLGKLCDEAPSVFRDFIIQSLPDGSPTVLKRDESNYPTDRPGQVTNS